MNSADLVTRIAAYCAEKGGDYTAITAERLNDEQVRLTGYYAADTADVLSHSGASSFFETYKGFVLSVDKAAPVL